MDQNELKALVSIFAELHAWELANVPLLQTTTGQHLYHTIAQRAVCENGQLERSLKDVFSTQHFTERALRNRMQDMSEQGLLVTHQATTDGRNKHLVPTEQFYEKVYEHAAFARKLLRKNFIVLPR